MDLDCGPNVAPTVIPHGIIVNGRHLRVGPGMAQPPRERITAAVEDLFSTEGLRVSVDAIAAKASTTKMAIYRTFGSKEALVLAWLRGKVAEYVAVFESLREQHPDDAYAQIMGWVAFVTEGLSTTSYRGCPFVNSLAELPDGQDPARLLIEAHKSAQLIRLEELCQQAGIERPSDAAGQLNLVLEGAQVVAQNGSDPAIGSRTSELVALILGERHRS